MHLILTGATGLVGSGVLDAMLKSTNISRISIISRRPVPAAADDPRVQVIIHDDFSKYDTSLLGQLQGASGVVWALGTSALKVSKPDYIAITKSWPLTAAEAFSTLGTEEQPFRFVYVSGEGATHNPTFTTSFFGRVKGETELALSKLQTDRLLVNSVRPAGVDASDHKEIKPFIPEPSFSYKVMGAVLMPMMRFMPSFHSPTKPLGEFLTRAAMGEYDGGLAKGGSGVITIPGGSKVVENVGFRRLYGLS